MAVKISAVIADKITASNNEAFESVLNKIERLNLKGEGQLLPPEVEVLKTIKPDRIANDEGDDQFHIYSRDWLVDDVY